MQSCRVQREHVRLLNRAQMQATISSVVLYLRFVVCISTDTGCQVSRSTDCLLGPFLKVLKKVHRHSRDRET